jgi:hypothetical protein
MEWQEPALIPSAIQMRLPLLLLLSSFGPSPSFDNASSFLLSACSIISNEYAAIFMPTVNELEIKRKANKYGDLPNFYTTIL